LKRALILFGAGASIEYGVPSTSQLTDLVEREIATDAVAKHYKGDVAAQMIFAELRKYLTKPGNINFEQVYHCAHELLVIQPATLGAYDEFKPILLPFLIDKTGLSRDALKILCQKIVEVIYREVSRSCETLKVPLDDFAGFIAKIRETYVTRIYTTNYDDLPLQAAPDLSVGFKTANSPSPFDLRKFWHEDNRDSLYHLHGSVRMGYGDPTRGFDIGDLAWFDSRSEAIKHASFSGSSIGKMDGTSLLRTPIVTGLEKLSRIQQRPFSHFYSMLARDAMRADIIFVIGSGLTDLHLNTWLKEARLRSPKPPLLFIDYWAKGFEDTYFDIDRKGINLFHDLQVHINDYDRGKKAGSWLISSDQTAAIWDKGFHSFLGSLNELDAVTMQLRGASISILNRVERYIYRFWAKRWT
jgi:NAD-dependent SIR2 family protein deacetylase